MPALDTARYAQCIEASKRVRWDIDRDVIRGRHFDLGRCFLPAGLSLVGRLSFLHAEERRLLSQIQGRTYANMFGLVERFIGVKMLELSRDHELGDQVALEALVRFTDEEIKHQALFRRIDAMLDPVMPAGYEFVPEANAVAHVVLGASTWAVLALTCHIEHFTRVHYRESLDRSIDLCEVFKDVFLYHWKEESQHAVLDELEWLREDARLGPAQRDRAVDDFIGLLSAVEGILQAQAGADTSYFLHPCGRVLSTEQEQEVALAMLCAYRWQYIESGIDDSHFRKALDGMLTPEQSHKIKSALTMLLA